MTAVPWGSLFFMCLHLLPVPQAPFFPLFTHGCLLPPYGTGSEASFVPSLASSPTPFSFPFSADWVYLSGSPQTLVCTLEVHSSETLTASEMKPYSKYGLEKELIHVCPKQEAKSSPEGAGPGEDRMA